MLGDSININNLNLCCNPVVLKKKKRKMVKLLKNCFLGAQFAQKWGHYGPHPKWKTIFFGRNN